MAESLAMTARLIFAADPADGESYPEHSQRKEGCVSGGFFSGVDRLSPRRPQVRDSRRGRLGLIGAPVEFPPAFQDG